MMVMNDDAVMMMVTSSVLVLTVDLMMFITISGETEFDSKFSARIDLFD